MGHRRRKHRIRTVTAAHNLDATNVPFNAETALDEVDNPYETGAARIPVTRSIRDDPLAALYSRRHIDATQLAAGRRFQQHYDEAGIGSIVAMDPLKEPVDGSSILRAELTERQLDAFRQLRYALQILGLEGYHLVCEILVRGYRLERVARDHGYHSSLGVPYLGMRFRECLKTLATGWGLVSGRGEIDNSTKSVHR